MATEQCLAVFETPITDVRALAAVRSPPTTQQRCGSVRCEVSGQPFQIAIRCASPEYNSKVFFRKMPSLGVVYFQSGNFHVACVSHERGAGAPKLFFCLRVQAWEARCTACYRQSVSQSERRTPALTCFSYQCTIGSCMCSSTHAGSDPLF